MGDSIVAQLINEVGGISMTFIKEKLGYWWNSRKNVEEMGRRMKQLSDTAEDMKRKKEDNHRKNLVVPHHVPTWLEEFESINNKVASIPTDGIGIGCFNIKMSYKAGKDSYDILKGISDLQEREPKIRWTDEEIALAKVPSRNAASSSSPVDEDMQSSFESRDLIFKEALMSLEPKNSKTHMVALCGMGGVGKSHMMEKLENALKDSKMFYWVVRVVVGENTHVAALQDAVADKTGGALTKLTQDARAQLLKIRFLETSKNGENKILVILDDVWKVLELKDLGLPSPLPNGFKLLMTSRDEKVCTQMGVDADSIFRIGALNDVEAKTLFFKIVGLSKDDDPGLYEIGEDIIRKCFNLPISLKTIASNLTRDESDWKEALSRLQDHDIKDHYENIHNVFKISYDRLQKDDEKAIFLLCGLFPDDFDVPLEELIRYGWGLKLFPRTTLARARTRVESCVKSLIRANLLAESDCVGCVRMHDLARCFTLSNSTEVKQASVVKHRDVLEKLTEDANESYQRILLKSSASSEFPKDFNCPNLTFFKLMGGVEQLNFTDGFYNKMEKLEVLSYEDVLYPPLLSRSSLCSIHLRTLCLHGCELIPDWFAIGYLVNLDVLSFANSRIEKLPCVIGKLKKLKLLDLTGCIDLCIEDGVFRDLEKLEELYMRVSGQKAIQFTNANCEELEKLSMNLSTLEIEFFDNKVQPKNMSFKNLERFKISIGCLLNSDDDIYSFQNTLNLSAKSSDLLESGINELYKKTEKLHLELMDMKHLTDAITMHPSQYSFPKLRILEVCNCEELRYLFTISMADSIRKLEQLTVSHCSAVESLIHGDESDNDGVIIFQELKFLSLMFLPKLGSLCDIDKVVELPQLTDLYLLALPKITSIYPDSTMHSLFNKQVAVPKLENLNVNWMDNLKQIWPFEITCGEEVHISMVWLVEVKRCDSLVNLFPINPMPLLRNLVKLIVDKCNSLEVLFNIDLSRVDKVDEMISSSLRSIHVNSAENLTEVWRIKGAKNSQVRGFQSVENIYVHNCTCFREVFTPTTTNFDIKALLNIEMQDSLFNKVLQSLLPNIKATKIALCGMGSVGKTRMMEELVKAVEDKGIFDLVLKLVIGREANPLALQQAIAQSIGEELTQTATEAANAQHLYNKIMEMSQHGKSKILVILDDLWKELDLKDIGLPSPLPNGFNLLITSRDVNVCTMMGVEKSLIFRLGVEDDDKAKALFFEAVGVSKDDDPDLYEIGKEIIVKCGNFPMSLETIACVLKDNIKDKSKWKEALSRLQNQELEDIYDVLRIAFEMSYNNLKTDDEKAILFLSSFFPKEVDIPVEELIRYAWGLKLLPKVDTTTTLVQARHRIKTSVDVLIHANFLTESYQGGYFKMQHQARDFVLGNFTKVKQAFIEHGNMEDGAAEFCERIVLNCNGTSEFPVALNYPNLKLLKLMGEEKLVRFPQDFYDRMEKLEVLAYERIADPLLPSYSANLRTLCLDSCSLTGDFCFPGNFINLEILSFAHCGIKKLPSTIGKLRKLKLLDVTGCVDFSIEDGFFQKLVNLEELYMVADSESRISFTDANYEELEILLGQLCALEVELYENKLHPKVGSFKKLEKFRISMGCGLGTYIYSKNDPLNTLELVTNLSEVVEYKLNELFEKTEKLYLQVKDMKNLENVSFCNLRVLQVSECADLAFLFTVQVASGLTKLEELQVSSCPVLETLIHGSESGGSVILFPKLKSLNLRDLPRLMSLCDTENIRVELQQPVKLRLESLDNVTSIYPDDAMEAYSFLNRQVEIPKLVELRILYMEKLKQIWPRGEILKEEVNNNDKNISKLRKIEVYGCDSLENLFPCNPLPILNHLEELHVYKCCSIKVLFNMDMRGAHAAHINQLTSSLREIKLWALENLREIWRIKGEVGGNNKSSSSLLHVPCFQAIEKIYIY